MTMRIDAYTHFFPQKFFDKLNDFVSHQSCSTGCQGAWEGSRGAEGQLETHEGHGGKGNACERHRTPAIRRQAARYAATSTRLTCFAL